MEMHLVLGPETVRTILDYCETTLGTIKYIRQDVVYAHRSDIHDVSSRHGFTKLIRDNTKVKLQIDYDPARPNTPTWKLSWTSRQFVEYEEGQYQTTPLFERESDRVRVQDDEVV